jgi:hypothetical protein
MTFVHTLLVSLLREQGVLSCHAQYDGLMGYSFGSASLFEMLSFLLYRLSIHSQDIAQLPQGFMFMNVGRGFMCYCIILF